MTTQVTNTGTAPRAPSPDTPGHTVARVTALLMRLQAAPAGAIVLTPIAELRPTLDETGDAFVFATVFVDCGDGRGRMPSAVHELRIAADCLSDDPPFAAAPDLATRLRDAADQAAGAALALQRSA